MSDCRIKLLIFQRSSENLEQTVQNFASDATLRDVRDFIFDGNFSFWKEEMRCARIWDCTLHPPKDITDWLFDEFPDYSGPRAKTLFNAGCFPSSTWHILPLDVKPVVRSVHEDTQYNRHNNTQLSIGSKVDLVLDNRIVNKTPSQLLNEVMNRDKAQQTNTTVSHKSLQSQNPREKEAARNALLEARILRLSSISSSTSLQVRTMLIKNRCTGDKNLIVEDRVYLHISVVSCDDNDDDVTEHFRYFSRLDTIAKVIQSFAPSPPKSAEFLIYTDSSTLRRLPILLRLSEAIEKSYLKQTTSIIIRCFTPGILEPTTSVLDEQSKEDNTLKSIEISENTLFETPMAGKHSQIKLNEDIFSSMTNEPDQPPQEIRDQIQTAICELDSKIKSKKSTTSLKVRQMSMKGRAKGDVKRTPDMQQRFFLELLLLEGDTSKAIVVFMGRKDTVERLIKEHTQIKDVKVYCILKNRKISSVPINLKFEELEAKELLSCFDRLFLIRAK